MCCVSVIQVPAKGFLPPKEYAKPTQGSLRRKLPLRTVEMKLSALSSFDNDVEENQRRKNGRGLAEPLAAKNAREENQLATLRQIEDVLDNLNGHTAIMAKQGAAFGANAKENIAKMKTFAKPTTQIDGLVNMINEVIGSLE